MTNEITELNDSCRVDTLIFKTLGTKVNDDYSVEKPKLNKETVIKAINQGANIKTLSLQSYCNLVRNILIEYIDDKDIREAISTNIYNIAMRKAKENDK